jgi:glycosyltransferase involved in cell wall biosynthesis
MEPLVSIITASYNSEKTIKDTIESVIGQHYRNWELIIVDDGSTDHSVELIAKIISTDDRIRLLKNAEGRGPAAARNLALTRAGGKYIAFIDSDDIWRPNFLTTSVALLERERLPLVISSYKRISEDGRNSFGDFIVPRTVSYAMLLKTCYINCSTAVYNAEIIGKRYFSTGAPVFEDYLYWLSILKEGYLARGQQEILSFYRIRRGSLSRNKRGRYKYFWFMIRDVEKHSFWKSVYLVTCYIAHGIRKNYPFIFLK